MNIDPQISEFVYETDNGNMTEIATIEELEHNKVMITLRGSIAADLIGDRSGKYYESFDIDVPDHIDISMPFGLSEKNPFPDNLVLDHSEQVIIENVISSYNSNILEALFNSSCKLNLRLLVFIFHLSPAIIS